MAPGSYLVIGTQTDLRRQADALHAGTHASCGRRRARRPRPRPDRVRGEATGPLCSSAALLALLALTAGPALTVRRLRTPARPGRRKRPDLSR